MSYVPLFSTMNMANITGTIMKCGDDIVTIVLDDAEFPCYYNLKHYHVYRFESAERAAQ